MMQLGLIGLGRMGGSMAVRLVQGGHDCVVYDSHRAAVATLFARFGSRGEADYADRLLSALRFGLGGHSREAKH